MLPNNTPLAYMKALLVGFGVVLFWRGVWGFLDEYFLVTQPFYSYLLSFIFGLVILAVTHSWLKELE